MHLECVIKLVAAGSHLSIVRVAIYVVYLRHEIFNMQHKESILEHLLPDYKEHHLLTVLNLQRINFTLTLFQMNSTWRQIIDMRCLLF
jgi:hypothetical protein